MRIENPHVLDVLATGNQSVFGVEMHVISSHILICHVIVNGKIAK